MQRKTMFYQRFVNWIKGSVIIDFSTEHNQYLLLILIFFFIFYFLSILRTAALSKTAYLKYGLHKLKNKTRSSAMRQNQVFNDSTRYWCDRNKKWQWRKNDAVILVEFVACTKFGVNRPKQTKVFERKLNFFSNSDLDLDHRHLGSNPKLRLDVSYPYSKFGVNEP